MMYQYAHIIFLILLETALFGQNTSSTFKPESDRSTIACSLNVKILTKGFFFSKEHQILIPPQSLSGDQLRLDFSLIGADLSSTELSYEFNVSGGVRLEKVKIGESAEPRIHEVFTLNNLSSNPNSYILLNLKTLDDAVDQTYKIFVSQLVDCKNKSTHIEELDCLKRLTYRSEQQEADFHRLQTDQQLAHQGLNNFSQSKNTGKNIYSISCNSCTVSDYQLTVNSNTNKIRTRYGWRIGPITRTTSATISHPQWQIDKTFNLRYSTQEKERKPVSSKRVRDDAITQAEVDTTIFNDSTSQSIDTLALQQDLYWQDSIVPLLSLANVFNKDIELFRRLEVYQGSPTATPIKKALGSALPYALPILGVFLAFLLFWVIKRSVKSRKNAIVKDKMSMAELELTAEPTIATQIVAETSTGEEDEISFNEVSLEVDMVVPPLEVVMSHPHYIPIDLLPCWRDTNVERIFFHRNCIRDLRLHLDQESNAYETAKNVEELAEIGGFLLGYVYPQDDRYDLAVATFIPITPESNDRYAVKFGDQAWTQLDDAFRLYPGQRLIGWFHTHPGHGLFLSKADIDLHESAFQRPYQFAMEVDPVTTQCDVAFFTRQPNGRLNNVKNRRISQWWSFQELEQKAKIL